MCVTSKSVSSNSTQVFEFLWARAVRTSPDGEEERSNIVDFQKLVNDYLHEEDHMPGR